MRSVCYSTRQARLGCRLAIAGALGLALDIVALDALAETLRPAQLQALPSQDPVPEPFARLRGRPQGLLESAQKLLQRQGIQLTLSEPDWLAANSEMFVVSENLAAKDLSIAFQPGKSAASSRCDSAPGGYRICGADELRARRRGLLTKMLGEPSTGEDFFGSVLLRRSTLREQVSSLRADVPSAANRLLAGTELANDFTAVELAWELGFEQVTGFAELVERAAPADVGVKWGDDGSIGWRADLRLPSGGRLTSVLADATETTLPSWFDELPATTQLGMVASVDVVRRWLWPSARAIELATKLGAARPQLSGVVATLTGLNEQCLVPGSAAALALVSTPDLAVTTQKPALKGAAAKAASTRATSYTLLGFPDAKGACLRALSAAVDQYLAAAGGSANEGARRLPTPRAAPKGTLVVGFGTGKGERRLTLIPHGGAAWLTWSVAGEPLPVWSAVSPRAASGKADDAESANSPFALAGFVIAPFGDRDASQKDPTKLSERMRFRARVQNQTLHMSGRLGLEQSRAILAKGLRQMASSGDDADNIVLLDASCHLGLEESCNRAGLLSVENKQPDWPRAQRFFQRACDANHPMGCTNLGHSQRETDPAAARRNLRRACDLRSELGCSIYGDVLLVSAKSEDRRAATEPLEFACNAGIGAACLNLGYQWMDGVGVAADAAKGSDYYERGCQLQDGMACVGLGYAYANGNGRRQDAAKALQAYERACELKQPYGCFGAANSLWTGVGAAKDPQRALRMFAQACDGGHAESCRVLAELREEQP